MNIQINCLIINKCTFFIHDGRVERVYAARPRVVTLAGERDHLLLLLLSSSSSSKPGPGSVVLDEVYITAAGLPTGYRRPGDGVVPWVVDAQDVPPSYWDTIDRMKGELGGAYPEGRYGRFTDQQVACVREANRPPDLQLNNGVKR